jgi:hypothetical protein
MKLTMDFFNKTVPQHTAHCSMELLQDCLWRTTNFKRNLVSASLDLSPPDFFLWGAPKSKVYDNNPKSTAELKTAIQSYVQPIAAETLSKVFDNKGRRVTACQEQGGKHFQHFL